ncbi:MAG: methyltransferase domain-containing protein [Planctomycetes bacterium]|nr:methyltransferase domain-containing protein [Planctomycetota bacterium]
MKPLAEQYYDRVAPRYDATYTGPYWDFYREITWHHLKRYLPRDLSASILDVGGGTGVWSLEIAKHGYRVTCSDLSQKMLDEAGRKSAEAGLDGRISLVKADIADLAPFADASVDFLVAQGDPLSYCSDPRRGAKAIARVLKPGGTAVVSVDQRWSGLDLYCGKRDLDALERFARSGESVWLANDPSERFPLHMFDPSELSELFTRAGCEKLSMIGKTVLPVREHAVWLEDREAYRRLLRLETRLHAEPALLGRASHLEIAVRRAHSFVDFRAGRR